MKDVTGNPGQTGYNFALTSYLARRRSVTLLLVTALMVQAD